MQALMELEELQLFLLLRPFLLCGVGSFVRLRLFRRGGRAFFGHREVTLRHFSRGDTLSDAGGGRSEAADVYSARLPLWYAAAPSDRGAVPTGE